MSDFRNPFQIVQERSVSFDSNGKTANAVLSYIKLHEGAESMLGEMHGVKLTVFLSLSLHEISVCKPNGAMPYTRPEIIEHTKDRTGKATISERAVQYACTWLVEHNFIFHCGTRANGEKMYRPRGTYAWFGDDVHRGANFAPPHPTARGAVDCTPPAKASTPGCNLTQTGVQSLEEEVDSNSILNKENSTSSGKGTRGKLDVRAALARCGMYAKRADVLAERVDLELAKRWERWCAYARANLPRMTSPAFNALQWLEADPTMEPPDFNLVEEWERDQAGQCGEIVDKNDPAQPTSVDVLDHAEPVAQESPYAHQHAGIDGTVGDLWHAVLGELQLQMTRATFDTWVRQSRALGWDDSAGEAVLVVGVHTPYAKEWLENRLQMRIERTVVGIVGKPVTVRYEVHENKVRVR